jgi:hypothetical protein
LAKRNLPTLSKLQTELSEEPSMISPLDLIEAHPWRSAVFTTYSLSLSFFEALVLDRLVRGGGRGAFILSDLDGVRGALSEQGARRAGREYDVEPVSVHTGVFHPKLTVLIGEGDCHLLVGSGNLTFGGWGGNLEVFEHVHAGFAVDAIRDASEFFELLADSPNARHGAALKCQDTASALRQSAIGKHSDGNTRLLHTLRRSISAQIEELVEDLGGATRLIVASPFWDKGAVLDSLCRSLKLDIAHVHSHPAGSVQGCFGSNWPRHAATSVAPICLDILKDEERRLHAKVFEVLCKRGRAIFTGSPNATSAALGGGGNIEACVARIQRDASVGWTYVPAEVPDESVGSELENESFEQCGVLRARLEGDMLYGEVLEPKIRGMAKAILLTSEGEQSLGPVTIDRDSRFSMRAAGLELRFLQGSNFTLRVQGSEERAKAEGFISLAVFSEISRRSGTMAPRLFALLTATETPADVAAIMSWIGDDPTVLARDRFVAGGGNRTDQEIADDRTVAISKLREAFTAPIPGSVSGAEPTPNVAWKRFIDAFLASLRQHRSPFPGQTLNPVRDDDDDVVDQKEPDRKDPWIQRSLNNFRRVFELLLSPENAVRYFSAAFSLTQYVCRRLEPEQSDVREWLKSLVQARSKYDISPEEPAAIAAAILVLYSDEALIEGARGARLQLLRLGFPCEGDLPDMEPVEAFRTALALSVNFGPRWEAIKNVRTMPEQVRSYLAAVSSSNPSSGYPDMQMQKEEWPILENAISDPSCRDGFRVVARSETSCPRCSRGLPQQELYKLRSQSVAIARNCCGRVLICEEL